MPKIQLEFLFQIIGIGSASGLVFTGDSLFLIADSSTFLYNYNLKKKELNRIKLLHDSREDIIKKRKPDFEAITKKGDQLYIFGSGSTERRKKLLIYDLYSKKVIKKDLSGLYQTLQEKADLNNNELNIEGALFYGDALYLFQRGNGTQSKNGIFIIDGTKEDIAFFPLALPKIQHIEAAFTDAILVNDKIYFLAAAENTISTYHDGEVLGTLVGILDPKTMTIDHTEIISSKHKFEGLAYFEHETERVSFLLCEDTDTGQQESNIYQLIMKI